MGSTNKTTNLQLPQWIGTDKPTFLGDMNDAFLKIDNGYSDIQDSATTAKSQAGQALSKATNAENNVTEALETANTANTTAGEAKTLATSASTTANTALTTANNAKEDLVDVNNVISSLTNWTQLGVSAGSRTTDLNVTAKNNSTLKMLNMYGNFNITGGVMANLTLFTLSGFAPSNTRTIQGGFSFYNLTDDSVMNLPVNINSNGTVTSPSGAGTFAQFTSCRFNLLLVTVDW